MDSSFRPTRREADLSNLINNATARDELFARNNHVSVMKQEMVIMKRKEEEYEKCLQSVLSLVFVPCSMNLLWRHSTR